MAIIAPSAAAKPARWRVWLGIALILPIPLIWYTAMLYATHDFYTVDRWLGYLVLLSIPAMSLTGIALLPLKTGDRAIIAIFVVPAICVVHLFWGFMFACGQFGDCR